MIQDLVTSSGSKAASAGGNIVAAPCALMSYMVTPAAADATLTLYDNALGDTSGTVLATIFVKSGTSSQQVVLTYGVRCNKGLSYSLVGAASTALVHYTPL